MNNANNLTSPRQLFSLTWPIFIELSLQMLVGNVDQIMISRFSQNSVGAIGNANQIINVLILTFSVISMASTILITQYLGSGNQRRVYEIYTISLFVNVIFSFIISVIILFFNKPLFILMRVPQEILQESSVYISIIGGFMVLQGIYLTFSSFLRANAMMKESMIISIVINVLNIAGNALLLYGVGSIPPLGVVGVAISSNFSRFIGIIMIVLIFIKRFGPCISLKYLIPFPWKQLKLILSIGVPSGGESLSYNFTQMVIQGFANLFGTLVINAKVYCSMFAMLSYIFASSLSQACQIVVGYLIGARNMDGTHRQVQLTLYLSIAASATISLLLFLFHRPLFSIFTNDPNMLKLIGVVMLIEIPLEIGRAVNMTMVRSLQAAGDIKFPITIGIICMWAFAVGVGYFLGVVLGWGLAGIWLGMALDESIRAVCFILRWYRGKWRSIQLISQI
ncbi:MAG: MATE family efflux transporter [Angelakisella sp.]|nr:MATE family efflux transporter [Angelakisella sp.]